MKNHLKLLTTLLAIAGTGILYAQQSDSAPGGTELTGFVQDNLVLDVQDYQEATIRISNKQVLIDGYWEFKDETGQVLEQPIILSQPGQLTDKLLLALRRPGTASVTVVENGEETVYTITVEARFEENNIEKELESAIYKFVGDPGLIVKVLPPQAALVGANLNRAFGEQTASEILAPRGEAAGVSTGEVTAAGDFRPTIILDGVVRDDVVSAKAESIARAYTQNVINMMTIANPLQVRMNVKVIQVTRTKDSQIGIKHRGAATDIATGTTLSGLGLVFTSTAPFFETGAGNDLPIFGDLLAGSTTYQTQVNLNSLGVSVNILQEPTLTVLNGQPAEFIVGQAFFVPTSFSVDDGVTTQSFEERNIGVSLRMTPIIEEEETFREVTTAIPFNTISSQKTGTERGLLVTGENNNFDTVQTVDANGVIRLTVQPEISTLQGFDANNLPIINVSRVESRVALRDGEALVLGGLFDDQQRRTMQKVPFLADIPILGELFKDRGEDFDKNELVFVLTPEILGIDDNLKKSNFNARDNEIRLKLIDEGVTVKPTRISSNDVFVRSIDSSDMYIETIDTSDTESDPMLQFLPPDFDVPDESVESTSEDQAPENSTSL